MSAAAADRDAAGLLLGDHGRIIGEVTDGDRITFRAAGSEEPVLVELTMEEAVQANVGGVSP